MKHTFVSIDRIFSKFIRDIGTDFTEDDIIEWTGEALDFIGTQRILDPHVAFLEVKNHMAPVPKGCLGIDGIARDNRWAGPKASLFCPKKVISEVAVADNKPDVPVALDCKGTPINAYELAYYRPYFDFKWGYNTFSNTEYFQRHYTPVREATHTFFGTKVNNNIATDRYQIVHGTILKFSFETGYVAIGYKKARLDPKTGYPMIPDSVSHTTAIVNYIAKKRAEKDMDAGRQGAFQRVQYWGSEWDWYCGQASNNDKMIQGVDELQNLLDQRTQLIPQYNQYHNFFGNLAQPQNSWEGYEEGEFLDEEGTETCTTEEESCEVRPITVVNNTYENHYSGGSGSGGGAGVVVGVSGRGGEDDPVIGLSIYQNIKIRGLRPELLIMMNGQPRESYGINKTFDFDPNLGRLDFGDDFEWVEGWTIRIELNQIQ